MIEDGGRGKTIYRIVVSKGIFDFSQNHYKRHYIIQIWREKWEMACVVHVVLYSVKNHRDFDGGVQNVESLNYMDAMS